MKTNQQSHGEQSAYYIAFTDIGAAGTIWRWPSDAFTTILLLLCFDSLLWEAEALSIRSTFWSVSLVSSTLLQGFILCKNEGYCQHKKERNSSIAASETIRFSAWYFHRDCTNLCLCFLLTLKKKICYHCYIFMWIKLIIGNEQKW